MAATMLASSRVTCQSYIRFVLSLSNRRIPQIKAAQRSHSRHIVNSHAAKGQLSIRKLATESVRRNLSHWVVPSFTASRKFHVGNTLCDSAVVVKTPSFPESVSEGDIRWEKEAGDSVAEDEVVGEIETDKTAIEVRAPVAGVLGSFLVPDGETVVAGQDLFTLSPGGDGAAKPVEASAPPTPAPAPTKAPTPTPATPSSVAGPIPTTPPPVPPVPKQPISSKPVSDVAVTPAIAASASAAPSDQPTRSETRTKMNRMRQRIAQRLTDAKDTYAMLTTFNEIDMSNVMELRKQYKDAFLKKHNLKLGFMSAFLKASAYALQHQPVVNAVIDDIEIVYRDYIDISVAVATPKGLVVPVLRNVETMSYAGIEQALAEVGEKAKTGNLAIEDMDGGTFTVSNGGVFGSLMGTPIINPPQSAILGMHGIFDRPVAVNGKVEIRPMMYVALTYDHRLIDGREAVTFLRKVKSAVEDPRVLLLDL